MNTLGWQDLKVVALAVDDLARAESFYRTTLGLEPISPEGGDVGFMLGGLMLLLKPATGQPAGTGKSAYPRLTIGVEDAPAMERELAARGVTISDEAQLYEEGQFWVGAFLDSEGNKLWFCSEARRE